MEKTGCKIICGAPTTLAVKGLMMKMMMRSDQLMPSQTKLDGHPLGKISRAGCTPLRQSVSQDALSSGKISLAGCCPLRQNQPRRMYSPQANQPRRMYSTQAKLSPQDVLPLGKISHAGCTPLSQNQPRRMYSGVTRRACLCLSLIHI